MPGEDAIKNLKKFKGSFAHWFKISPTIVARIPSQASLGTAVGKGVAYLGCVFPHDLAPFTNSAHIRFATTL